MDVLRAEWPRIIERGRVVAAYAALGRIVFLSAGQNQAAFGQKLPVIDAISKAGWSDASSLASVISPAGFRTGTRNVGRHREA
jgi:hypothetical protein